MLRRDDGERRLTNLLHLGEQIHQAAATHDRRTRCCAGWRRSGARAPPTRSRSCASNPTAISSRSSPSTRRRASSSRSCSARSCGTAARASAGRSRKGASITTPTATRSSTFASTTRSAPTKPAIDAQIKLEAAAESLRLIYVALTRAVYRCYLDRRHLRDDGSADRSPTESTQEPAQLARRRRHGSRREWLAGEALAGRHRRRVGSARRSGLRPTSASRRCRSQRGTPVAPTGPSRRNRSPRCRRRSRSRPRGASAASAASPATRAARAPPATTTRGSPSVATAHRRAAAGHRAGRHPALSARRRAPAIACTRSSSASTSPTRPAGTTPSPAACPRIRNSCPACARRSNRRCSRGMAARMLADVMSTTLPDGIVLGVDPARTGGSPSSNSACRRRACRRTRSTPRCGASATTCRASRSATSKATSRASSISCSSTAAATTCSTGNRITSATRASDYGPRRAAGGDGRAQLPPAIPALCAGRRPLPRAPRAAATRHDTHFGGVLYLFVRGVRPDWVNADGTPAGVFHDRPSAATLARLDALFAQRAAKVAP